jgi:hypothetical protein
MTRTTPNAMRRLSCIGAACALLALAGCDATDPTYRDGLWHPMHVNRTNLTLTAAYPADLVRGSGVTGTDGVLAAAAIDRLHINKVKKLPEAGLSEVKVSSQGSASE